MFDLTKTEIQDDYAPIPNGLYPVYVDEVSWKQSKAGAEYLNVKFKVFGENYTNRVLWNVYNVMHPKEQVRNIAFSDIKKMLLASGVDESSMTFTEKEQLAAAVKDVRCMVKVSTKTDDYGAKNVIKGYEELDEKIEETKFDRDSIPF